VGTQSDPAAKTFIYDLDLPQLKEIIASWDEPAYRAPQIWHGIYKSLWNDPGAFTNLSHSLQARMAEQFDFSHLLETAHKESYDKETRKTLFILPDQQPIEAVLMQYERRRTLCISSQAGCAMGCSFCLTARQGLKRNLLPSEITGQVLAAERAFGRDQVLRKVRPQGADEADPAHQVREEDSEQEKIARSGTLSFRFHHDE